MKKSVNKFIKKYMPKKTLRQCSSCNGYFRSMIILNGSYVCHGCYSRRYNDFKNFHSI